MITAELIFLQGRKKFDPSEQNEFKVLFNVEDWMDVMDVVEKVQEAYEDHGYTLDHLEVQA